MASEHQMANPVVTLNTAIPLALRVFFRKKLATSLIVLGLSVHFCAELSLGFLVCKRSTAAKRIQNSFIVTLTKAVRRRDHRSLFAGMSAYRAKSCSPCACPS
jgi:hypothetical protein